MLHDSLFEMAAAYVFHIVQNHPFLDGNKRTGIVSCLVFLIINGYNLHCPNEDLFEMVIRISQGDMDKNNIAEWLLKFSHKM